jgi:hypothetical protein
MSQHDTVKGSRFLRLQFDTAQREKKRLSSELASVTADLQRLTGLYKGSQQENAELTHKNKQARQAPPLPRA